MDTGGWVRAAARRRFSLARRSSCLLALAALAALAAGCGGSGGSSSHAGSSAHGASAARGFDPRSVSFVSLRTAWALGTTPCASSGACLELLDSSDTGRSWSSRPLPATLIAAADRKVDGVASALDEGAGLSVRFADAKNGWIYGGLAVTTRQPGGSYVAIEPTLWSTHDGGLVWRAQPLRGLGSEDAIFDLEAAGGTAYLMATNSANGVSVESSPVDADSWQSASSAPLGDPAGGGLQSGAFVLQGGSGWLVEGNDRGTTGSARLVRGGRWVNWTPPCASVGHSFAIPAAATAQNLVAVCVMGGFASSLSKSAPPGAKLGSSWLYFSNDGGSSFATGPELGGLGYSFSGVIASPTPAAILIGHQTQSGQADLLASFDRGVHWSVVYRGQALYLGFTSPSQGVAILGSANDASTTMIMTFDGGHHWAPVAF